MFRPGQPTDLPDLAYILSRAFGSEESSCEGWMERAGWENVRVVERDGRPAATTVRIPMGMFFGGQSVSNVGIAGVATAPEARGGGLAQKVVGDTLLEARRDFAITTLFPASWSLYRKLGYELAGDLFTTEIDVKHLTHRGVGAQVKRFEDSDREGVQAFYKKCAASTNGLLDRGKYIWDRVEAPRMEPADGFVFRFDDNIEAYVFMRRVPGKQAPLHNLAISDWQVSSARGAQALLSFLRSHGSMVQKLSYAGNVQDALTAQLDEFSYTNHLELSWMLRILDPARAFRERGYPAGSGTELSIEVTEDPLIPGNQGTWGLKIVEGQAEVSPAKTGIVRGHIRGISALYAGYRPATELARWGWLEGAPDALAQADIVFAGSPPCLDHLF